MPELPEVETTRRGVAPAIEGKTLSSVLVRESRLRYPVPPDLTERLTGLPLRSVGRRAKYLLLNFDTGSLIVHLGMSGSLRVVPCDTLPRKHDHVDIVFGTIALRLHDPRRFGAVMWAEKPEGTHPLLAQLGLEPLEKDFTGNWLYTISRQRRTPIKLFIMDSHILVGVGNIYASESLFRAGIHPKIPAGKLSLQRCSRLVEEIRATLGDAIKAGGSTLRNYVSADGQSGYFQQHYCVYGRDQQPCRQCEHPIRRLVMGQRATFYCPSCQH